MEKEYDFMEFCEYKKLKYILNKPKAFDSSKAYPTILILHGAGARGNDLNQLSCHPYFAITDTHTDFPFVSVAPQCNADTWFDIFEQLQDFSSFVRELDFVDNNRLYVMGASMGGYATWQIAMSHPEWFAAIVPICGGGMYWNAGRLKDVPVWAFHGAKDTCVFPEESKKMVNAVNNCGGSAKLTIYPENDHNSWSDTFKNIDVFNWLLLQKNTELADNVKCCQGRQFG